MGSGTLKLRSTKNKHTFSGRYRRADGRYIQAALDRITRVFDGDPAKVEARVSLRLVELLSAVQKMAGGGTLVISSGYRSPSYNKKLRDRGGTVAKSSLHQYGMAADLRVIGASSRKVWKMARARKMGGAGYYGSPWIHLDVGRVRAWTQRSAKVYVRSGVSDHNKRIMLITAFDRYHPGERVRARFIRMTAFPVGVRPGRAALEREEGEAWKTVARVIPRLGPGVPTKDKKCRVFDDIASMARVRWTLPKELAPGRYRLAVTFCQRQWEDMPEGIHSEPFEVLARPTDATAGEADRAPEKAPAAEQSTGENAAAKP